MTDTFPPFLRPPPHEGGFPFLGALLSELLNLVDQLTKPTKYRFPQVGDDGKWLKDHVVEHPPLLQQLEDAVRASLGQGRSGASSLARERNMLDSDALAHAVRIRHTVRAWCELIGVQPSRDTVVDLRRWYVAYQQQVERDDEFHARRLRGWVNLIEAKLDRPKVFEVTAPCPLCLATEWWDRDGARQLFPVVVEYREEGAAVLENAKALCRSCEWVWSGVTALRGLRSLIDETGKEAAS